MIDLLLNILPQYAAQIADIDEDYDELARKMNPTEPPHSVHFLLH